MQHRPFSPIRPGPNPPAPNLRSAVSRRTNCPQLAPSGDTVRSRTVEDALRAVGQKFASLGTKDVRKDGHGKIDFRIQRQLRYFSKSDAPPSRVKPIPITIILYITRLAFGVVRDEDRMAIADIIVIAFYFLLRPGEYTGTTNDDTPFLLADAAVYQNGSMLDPATAPEDLLAAATGSGLTFTTQKNGVRGEKIVHGRSGHPFCCPTRALVR